MTINFLTANTCRAAFSGIQNIKRNPYFGVHRQKDDLRDEFVKTKPDKSEKKSLKENIRGVALTAALVASAVSGYNSYKTSQELSELKATQLEKKELVSKQTNNITLDTISDAVEKASPSTVFLSGNISNGSGVIIRNEEGKKYILTNAHVVKNQELFVVNLYNNNPGKPPIEFTAAVSRLPDGQRADDSTFDLALLEIPESIRESRHLKAIEMRDIKKNPLKTGEMAIAIGAPISKPDSVTAGIISHPLRKFPFESNEISKMEDLSEIKVNTIQTDAYINGGSSGGALVDSAGRLVGINFLTTANERGSNAYAIRIDSVKEYLSKNTQQTANCQQCHNQTNTPQPQSTDLLQDSENQSGEIQTCR